MMLMPEVWEDMTLQARSRLLVSVFGEWAEGQSATRVLERFPYFEVLRYPPGTLVVASVFSDGTWYRRVARTVDDAILKAALSAFRISV